MTLTELRKEKQLRTTDLAAMLGVSQGYYSNLERGKRPFNDLLLKKTAKILGVRLSTLQEAVKSQPIDSYKLKSWMSGIKINGLPLIKSFYYYLETNGMDIRSLDDLKLKTEMRKFVEINIGFSILAELSENKNLLGNIRDTIYTYSFSSKTNMYNRNKNS